MNLPKCELCGRLIDMHQDILRQVTGWLRPQGSGGGQIVKRTETGHFAHRTCVEHGTPEGKLW